MPRLSNRCETCKRRKVKCDETRPACQRCTRQGYVCEGYVDRSTVRRRSPAFRDQTQRVAAKAEASYARGSSGATTAPRDSSQTKRFALIQEDEFPTVLISASPKMHSLPSINEMDSSRERRAQLLSTFIGAYLPQTSASAHVLPSHYSYMYILQDVVGQHPAIPSAVDALCLYTVGKTYADEDVVAKSKTIYGAALTRLARNLQRTRSYAPTGTMAAIAILAWCELNQGNSTNPDAWENHLAGAVSLLEAFEPSVWDTNQGRLFLQAIRYMLTCTGFLKRRSVILAKPEWLEIVNGSGSAEEPGTTLWVRLMNNISQIPGLLQETDEALTYNRTSSGDVSMSTTPTRLSPSTIPAGAEPGNEIDALLSRSFALRDVLQDWWDELQAGSPPDAAVLVPIGSQSWWESTPYDEAFRYIWRFSECKHCYCRLQYWFSMLALTRNILTLIDSGRAATTGPTGMGDDDDEEPWPTREEIEEELLDYAVSAARCVPTAFDPSTPPVSQFNAALSLKMAGETFRTYGLTDKFNWCKTMSERLEASNFCTPALMRLSP